MGHNTHTQPTLLSRKYQLDVVVGVKQGYVDVTYDWKMFVAIVGCAICATITTPSKHKLGKTLIWNKAYS